MTTLDPRGLEAALHAVEGEGLTSDGGTPHGWRCEHPDRYPDYCKCPTEMADSAITAYLAVTQPIVETVEELEALDEGAVVLDKMGDVSQRRGGYWCGFETKPLTDQIMRKFLPARVIWRPRS